MVKYCLTINKGTLLKKIEPIKGSQVRLKPCAKDEMVECIRGFGRRKVDGEEYHFIRYPHNYPTPVDANATQNAEYQPDH